MNAWRGREEQLMAAVGRAANVVVEAGNAPSMYGDGTALPPELAQVVACWGNLPQEVKVRILAMVAPCAGTSGR